MPRPDDLPADPSGVPLTVLIIPNWNGEKLLSRFLPSILALGASRVLVVDNGSTDNSLLVARRLGADTLPVGRNLGFAGAVNLGIRSSKEPLIGVLNNDAEFAPGWLAALWVAMRESGSFLGCGKTLRGPRGEGDAVVDGTFDLLSRGGTAWRAGNGSPDAPCWNLRRSASFVPLTAALIRREAFDQAGLLDEAFESYLEDVEFSLRCARLGLPAIYEPRALAWHLGSATLGAWHAETARRISRNQVALIAKHYPRGWLWRYGRSVLAGQLLWGLVAARHGAGWAYLRGKAQGLRSYSRYRQESAWWKRDSRELQRILDSSEGMIEELQTQGGWQTYWRTYFQWAGSPRPETPG
jgi:GT2 family glycosyltransferase